ncbi:hypothetical protein C8Q77DRAFT_313743 [Trametes polyzona]|nr:hypothetical protein C8Q77DRAFT_313743 [Trametes polyzona]
MEKTRNEAFKTPCAAIAGCPHTKVLSVLPIQPEPLPQHRAEGPAQSPATPNSSRNSESHASAYHLKPCMGVDSMTTPPIRPGSQQTSMPNVFPDGGIATPSGQPLPAPQPAQQTQGQLHRVLPMPQQTFQSLYKKFSAEIPKDKSLLVLNNSPVDLYKMHCEVTDTGGINQVRVADACGPIVGVRLGYVNIQGTDTEPAKAGPELAHQLQNIYNEFLSAFDSRLITSPSCGGRNTYDRGKSWRMGWLDRFALPPLRSRCSWASLSSQTSRSCGRCTTPNVLSTTVSGRSRAKLSTHLSGIPQTP